MRARLVVILACLLAGLSLWIAAAPVAARLFGQRTVLAGNAAEPQDAARPEAVDLGPVLDAAPFGRADGARDVTATASPPDALVLLGITIGQGKDSSRAIIAGGDLPVGNYGIGSEITAGVVLAGFFPDHVILDTGGESQELHFLPGDGTGSALLSPASDVAAPDGDVPDTETLLGRTRAEILRDPMGLMARLGLEVTDQGYRVTGAASDEVLQAGLLPGDLVSGVNGTSLSDRTPDAALLDGVAALGQASLAVTRGGKALLMTFPLK